MMLQSSSSNELGATPAAVEGAPLYTKPSILHYYILSNCGKDWRRSRTHYYLVFTATATYNISLLRTNQHVGSFFADRLE